MLPQKLTRERRASEHRRERQRPRSGATPEPSHQHREGGMTSVDTDRTITVTVNGVPREATVPVRRLLSDALRHDLGLTGTHVGCEHGVCGACTVLVDGDPVRSCLLLAVQVDGASVTTVEGLPSDDGTLHPVQEAFRECHALQCGFCTPGFLMTIAADLEARDLGS